jgi:hypothetical protein
LQIPLADLVCNPGDVNNVKDSIYTAMALINYNRDEYTELSRDNSKGHQLARLGEQLNALRARFDEGRRTLEKCPGVAGFTEDDWHRLESIKPVEATPANH